MCYPQPPDPTQERGFESHWHTVTQGGAIKYETAAQNGFVVSTCSTIGSSSSVPRTVERSEILKKKPRAVYGVAVLYASTSIDVIIAAALL